MSERFDRVVSIMAALRAPGGCPWDRKQTHESLKPYLIEETYEALDTIDRHDFAKLKEELGDVLLQVLFHSQIGSEEGTFTIDDVLQHLSDKLVRRHPHVFGEGAVGQPALNADQVVHRWEDIKRAERQDAGKPQSVLHDIPQALPALLRAYQTQVRAARAGFDWPDSPQGLAAVLSKVEEEIAELREAVHETDTSTQPTPQTSAELGDLLFSLVNVARHLKVNPEEALRQATNRFSSRFRHIETQAERNGRTVDALTPEEMDHWWEEAKRLEHNVQRELPSPHPAAARQAETES
ncbi:nucleoside triphosphate pyrophosphohydrolase [Nitrospirales bacterium NOB]|nr:MAG: nucleoside triphosphate pyrophosphohydrolase [Nitrospira sp. OLB3]MBV6468642.1 Nucleoside triphosphate pyrophosphohydrolase/pyrophosphatase MazG [Nitrospirota bacterium]MCE7963979.1 nucleoside triphosphate pyrophosphohydrolase [Nitrospira sp. NTP2]MCK6492831.1 nucleoside triphosphate pyrophosphohydrolase [Nitrospira sp.]MDL1890070.1 nucleoside triphosphate pyrophosphohydrolase [Nitrospirales bacterium NOB]MEB2337173.1 nucleoside triphosphate pyrophosphohydrolase [Nitrospirales bacteriu